MMVVVMAVLLMTTRERDNDNGVDDMTTMMVMTFVLMVIAIWPTLGPVQFVGHWFELYNNTSTHLGT